MSAEALSKIYYEPKTPGSLDNVEWLLQRAWQLHVPYVTRKTVQEYPKSEHAYTLHKPARRWFTRYHTMWRGSMLSVRPTRQIGGLRYLLTVIDVFSKFAWAVPVHYKNAKAITAAFVQVFTTAKSRNPQSLQPDKNKKFFNSGFQALVKRHGIQHFASECEQQASVVKRFNRTITTRIWTYLSDRGIVR